MGKGFTIKIDDKKLQALLNKALTKNPVLAKQAMRDVTLDLKGQVQRRVPVDTGLLRGSAYAKVTGTSLKVIGEVGVNAPYALKQHEDLTLNHPKGGEAKYIERPFKESIPKIKSRFELVIKQSFK